MSFRVRALVVALGALVLAGCHAEGRVDVVVHDDGSGTVTVSVGLDAQAAQRVGDLATAVPTVDLVDAGWKVGHPSRSGALTWLDATKAFRSPRELGAVMGEVGMFRDWTVRFSDGFGSTSWKVAGRIVVSRGLDQFSDSDLAAALDGMPLGMTPAELSAALADSGPLPVTVRVRMPGATNDLTSIPVQLDASTSIDRPVQVESTRSSSAPTRWLVVAGILAALAAASYVANRLRRDARRSGPRRTRSRTGS